MSRVLPAPFFFRFALPVFYRAEMPRARGTIVNLREDCRLPQSLLGDAPAPFGDLRMAWNEDGLGLSLDVRGKTMPLHAEPQRSIESDGLQVWIDTRNTQSIHRASRFCHHFCFLPIELESRAQASGFEVPINRARESKPLADDGDLQVKAQIKNDGYSLQAFLPAKVLHGYDPEANPQLGFYFLISDAELGKQTLTVGEEFPYAEDPSIWSTLELVSE